MSITTFATFRIVEDLHLFEIGSLVTCYNHLCYAFTVVDDEVLL